MLDACAVFFPGQLLSEHGVFPQREAAVQVSSVGSLSMQVDFSMSIIQLNERMKDSGVFFDVAWGEPPLHDLHTLGPGPQP